MGLIVAGERSGVGKTTVTLALLSYLMKYLIKRDLEWECEEESGNKEEESGNKKAQNKKYQNNKSQNKHFVQSFKVGPDYIDPMFHKYVTGVDCINLDAVLTSEFYIKECFRFYSQNSEYSLVEGVMGLFDGVSNPKKITEKTPQNISQKTIPEDNYFFDDYLITSSYASTAHIARLLNLPLLLVIDCSRLSGSVAAIARGYASFDPQLKIAGLILNRVGSDRHLNLLKNSLSLLQIPILGVVRRQDNITIPDRHLGLIPTDEVPQLDGLIDRLADLGKYSFDWERLLPLLKVECENVSTEGKLGKKGIFLQLSPEGNSNNTSSSKINSTINSKVNSKIKIAIARDKAFNFYYSDNFNLLENLGAELVFWSPLKDKKLPSDISGIYFGGGFPEVFAEELSENAEIIQVVKDAITSGIPTIAECGGLMYLCEQIIDFQGKAWDMVGVIPAKTIMDKRLSLGYRRAIALQDTPLITQGMEIYGHEFHRSRLIYSYENPSYENSSSKNPAYDNPISKNSIFQSFRVDEEESIGNEGWVNLPNLHASYIHLHWGNNLEIPQRFLEQCRIFGSI